MNERAEKILEAMRADSIPEGESGLWRVTKFIGDGTTTNAQGQVIPPGSYMSLGRYTDATIHTDGVSVMSDDPPELRRHLDFVLRARGRVLLTGLGLGCVLRGVLSNQAVHFVDVVERDRDVLALVRPHLTTDRFQIFEADALEFVRRHATWRWSFAWHDLWSDTDQGEDHVALVHQRLILALRGRVEWQGAWAFPRHIKRVLRERFPTARAWANR